MTKLIKWYLLIVLMTTVFITGCTQNKNARDKIYPNESSLTFRLMNDKLWLSYYETTGSSFRFMLPDEFTEVLDSAKKEKGEGLNVFIKASDMIKNATIDTIVEMIKSRNISKYFVARMSKKESDSINMAVENFRKPLAMTLSMPKDEPEKNTILLEAKFVTVILLASGNLWCYEDTSLSSGALYHNNEFQHFISVKKKEFGDSILVVIKPTAQATYKATVDALDQMTINQIKRYAIVKPNEGEERFLSAKGIIELHAPIEIKTPKSTSSQSLSDSSTVIIDIKKDSSVWFTNFTGKNGIYDKVSIKLKEPITVELSQFIRSEKSLYSSYKREYIIRSAPNTDYRTFEKVIEALKQNNINKYNHITTAE